MLLISGDVKKHSFAHKKKCKWFLKSKVEAYKGNSNISWDVEIVKKKIK